MTGHAASPRETLRASGKQNSLFPLGTVIKCLLSFVADSSPISLVLLQKLEAVNKHLSRYSFWREISNLENERWNYKTTRKCCKSVTFVCSTKTDDGGWNMLHVLYPHYLYQFVSGICLGIWCGDVLEEHDDGIRNPFSSLFSAVVFNSVPLCNPQLYRPTISDDTEYIQLK